MALVFKHLQRFRASFSQPFPSGFPRVQLASTSRKLQVLMDDPGSPMGAASFGREVFDIWDATTPKKKNGLVTQKKTFIYFAGKI